MTDDAAGAAAESRTANAESARLDAHKTALETALVRCRERFESVQLLTSNGKGADAMLLMRQLAVDLANALLAFHDRAPQADAAAAKAALGGVPDAFAQYAAILERDPRVYAVEMPADMHAAMCLALQRSLGKMLDEIDTAFAAAKRRALRTPLDAMKRRHEMIRVGVLVLVLGTGAALVYQAATHPPLKPDYLQLYYFAAGERSAAESQSVRVALRLAPEWTTYSFRFPSPVDIVRLRFDPLNQRNVRIQLKLAEVFDDQGALLERIDFLLHNDLAPRDAAKIGPPYQWRPGENIPGGYWTVISDDIDPVIRLDTGPLGNVRSVEITMRVVPVYTAFED